MNNISKLIIGILIIILTFFINNSTPLLNITYIFIINLILILMLGILNIILKIKLNYIKNNKLTRNFLLVAFIVFLILYCIIDKTNVKSIQSIKMLSQKFLNSKGVGVNLKKKKKN